MSPRHLLCALLVTGTLAGCNSDMSDFGHTSIANGAIHVRHNEVQLHVRGAPDAFITAAGELKIDGQMVSINPSEREALKHYHAAASAIREHGIATGKAGVALAGESIKGAVTSIASGGEGNADKQIEDESQKVEQAAIKICQDVAAIKTAQDSLATQLVAFKPYATIIGGDTREDCLKDDDSTTVIR